MFKSRKFLLAASACASISLFSTSFASHDSSPSRSLEHRCGCEQNPIPRLLTPEEVEALTQMIQSLNEILTLVQALGTDPLLAQDQSYEFALAQELSSFHDLMNYSYEVFEENGDETLYASLTQPLIDFVLNYAGHGSSLTLINAAINLVSEPDQESFYNMEGLLATLVGDMNYFKDIFVPCIENQMQEMQALVVPDKNSWSNF